jgi:hypothetical protein
VLGAVKARPGNAEGASRAECRPALTPPARGGCKIWRSGWKNARGAGRDVHQPLTLTGLTAGGFVLVSVEDKPSRRLFVASCLAELSIAAGLAHVRVWNSARS